MEFSIPHTKDNGYDMERVLMKMDALKTLLNMLETGAVDKETSLITLDSILKEQLTDAEPGYDKAESDEYINELIEKIKNF